MSDIESDLEGFIKLKEKWQKEAREKYKEDSWKNINKQLSQIKLGIFFAAISPFVGFAVALGYLYVIHFFLHMKDMIH